MLPPSLASSALFLGILLFSKVSFSRENTCKPLKYLFTLISLKIIDLLDYYFCQQSILDDLKSFVLALHAFSGFIFKATLKAYDGFKSKQKSDEVMFFDV